LLVIESLSTRAQQRIDDREIEVSVREFAHAEHAIEQMELI